MDSFIMFRMNEYYIDKSLSLKGILNERNNKFLFTCPRRWGKTIFQQMMREFLSMSVDEKGQEIENHSFNSFENLKVVTEDRINIEDLLFLLRNYDKEITAKGIEEISDYFLKRNYPWFIQIKQSLSQSQKLERIQRLYARAREGFSCKEEELKQLNEQQITEYIENFKVNSPEKVQYFKLLSTFGETCKHFRKYPTIFVEFPQIFELYLSPRSQYNESLETEVKDSIAEAFTTHGYQLNYLKAQILKNNDSMQINELKQFESYLNSEEDPSDSLKFLSQSLYSHYQIPTVLIVDEYDKPMNHAYMIGETRYNQVRGCIAKVLACIKNEESIRYASLTGINRLSKANIFSDFNDLAKRSILDLEYADCFGFTASDVVELVKRYNQKNPQKQLKYKELKRWYNNYQIDGTVFFNPFEIILCLKNEGSFQLYWTDSGSNTTILELFQKIEVGKEEIALFLLKGEVEFCPLGSFSWEDMKQPTFQTFLCYLLHTEYLSLATGETVDSNKASKFVVPNQEIRNFIDYELMLPFYKMILESKFTLLERLKLVERAGSNEFTKNLNDNCIQNIEFSENHPKTEAYFKSVIFEIFFIQREEIREMLDRKRLDSVFYPWKSSEQRIAVLHEYKVCQVTDNNEEKALDAIWQCLTRNHLKFVSNGKMKIKDKESNWSEVKLRGIVFYPNMDTFRWCASSVEYTLSLKEVKGILKIFSCFENKQNVSREELLSGKQGTRVQIENERALFLNEHKIESLSTLIKSAPFKYQQTPSESKIKAGFSSVKLGFSPLLSVNYPIIDHSKCYPLSAGSSWRLQAFSRSSFKVLDIPLAWLCSNFSVCLQPTQQRNSLLKASLLVRSLKLLFKAL